MSDVTRNLYHFTLYCPPVCFFSEAGPHNLRKMRFVRTTASGSRGSAPGAWGDGPTAAARQTLFVINFCFLFSVTMKLLILKVGIVFVDPCCGLDPG